MKARISIPHDRCVDNTLKLLLEGYLFIPSRCQKYRSDLFLTRLMGQKVICMSGEKAAKLFYDNTRFTREGALPKRIQKSLFGQKAIQTLDGAAHLHRKNLFMSLMTPSHIDGLVQLTSKQWQINSRQWESKEQVNLFLESSIILCQAVCKWLGIPLKKYEVRLRTEDMIAMIDSFGAAGPRYWKGRFARNRTEQWMREIVLDVRAGQIPATTQSPLHTIAWHRDLSGKLLSAQLAAIELINLVRPTTAIATYIIFGVYTMNTYPDIKKKLLLNEVNYPHMLAQEIRRFYPFGPFLGARVKHNFTWNNVRFQTGTLVLLDIYGTNHDPKIWDNPNEFRPERFQFTDGNPYDFIPQGGGDYAKGHRCAGELITIELLKTSMNFLAKNLIYQVPLQDLNYSLRRMPTLPKSGFIISNVLNQSNGMA